MPYESRLKSFYTSDTTTVLGFPIISCMKHNTLITTIAVALLTFTATSAVSAADDAKTENATAADATADAVFMHAVTRGNLAEAKAADIAQGKTKRDDVKDFAKSIEKDHDDVNKNLATLADRMNMKMPKDFGDHQPYIDGLKAKEDADFDRTYVAATVTSHKKFVAMFEEFAAKTKNADLKAFANNTLPGLRTHLKHSETLLQTLGGDKAKATE